MGADDDNDDIDEEYVLVMQTQSQNLPRVLLMFSGDTGNNQQNNPENLHDDCKEANCQNIDKTVVLYTLR